jgi:mono/diheme cytochrome c family protein
MRSRFTALTLFLFAAAPRAAHAEESFFEKRIAPLLQQRCLSCHRPDKKKGDLDLSTRAGALKGGEEGPAVVPGKPADSLLLIKVGGRVPKMPRGGDPLSAAQVADVRRWIADGAPWPPDIRLAPIQTNRSGPDWWAYRPVTRPPVLKVKNAAWVRTPIDAFLLARLEAKNCLLLPRRIGTLLSAA